MKKIFFLLFIFNFLFPIQKSFAQNPPPTVSQMSVTTYEELVIAIRQTRAQSRERIEQAVEQEKVREAWETGKLIDQHVLQHKERANYGERVIERLAKDLDSSATELRFMLQFARTYPIHPPADELSWAHYREVLSLNDAEEREEVAKESVSRHWTRDQVREEVRRRQALKTPAEEMPAPMLTAQPGKVYTYRVVRAQAGTNKGKLVMDLGFSNYLMWPFDFAQGDQLTKDGDIIEVKNNSFKKLDSATEADLYTYPIEVIQVIDGDTFIASVDLGFGFSTVQKLRLRGIDAREIESAEGMEAKKFLEKKLKNSPVLIRTVKSDKYDRYLADVFAQGKYLNQELVDQRLAIVVSE